MGSEAAGCSYSPNNVWRSLNTSGEYICGNVREFSAKLLPHVFDLRVHLDI
jgi:hypothetical protein